MSYLLRSRNKSLLSNRMHTCNPRTIRAFTSEGSEADELESLLFNPSITVSNAHAVQLPQATTPVTLWCESCHAIVHYAHLPSSISINRPRHRSCFPIWPFFRVKLVQPYLLIIRAGTAALPKSCEYPKQQPQSSCSKPILSLDFPLNLPPLEREHYLVGGSRDPNCTARTLLATTLPSETG